ncbi:MAG: prepilin-type N-terminal cleavage/methylation domain-containing protein [Planctomycetota bacterium]
MYIDRTPSEKAIFHARLPGRAGFPSRSNAGFTFVEILLALVITGLVMTSVYGILVSTVRVKEMVEQEMDEVKAGALAFDLIRRDLQAATALRDGTLFFKSGRGSFGGGDEGAGKIDFVATIRNRFPDSSIFKDRMQADEDKTDESFHMQTDICEIGYEVKSDRDDRVLVRREDFYIDDDLEKGGVSMKLCRRVKAFSLMFYTGAVEGQGEEAVPEWDAEKEESLPFAVKVRLVLDRSRREGEEREKVFEAVIPLLVGERPPEEGEEERR